MRDLGAEHGETRTRTGDTTIFIVGRNLSNNGATPANQPVLKTGGRGSMSANCVLFSWIWALRCASVPKHQGRSAVGSDSGRPMKGAVFVDPPGFASDEALAAWVARARAFAETLPHKH
jgi:hypothetical protein